MSRERINYREFERERIKSRLEELRGALEAESISWGELAELQQLSEYINPSDVQLLEAAGVPEHSTEARAQHRGESRI